MKVLTPLLLIGLAIGLFFMYISPTYEKIKVLQAEKKELEVTKDSFVKAGEIKKDLAAKYASYSDVDLRKLDKFIPDNVDNIALIMNINAIANQYGTSIKGIKTSDPADLKNQGASETPYATLTMDFNIETTYPRFRQFIEELQSNLRLLDITSIAFTPATGETYDFKVAIKTYWLK